ncbi:MAG: phage tail protein [Myxococcales bacterium]|nr:phage tail protein [Myxococcales bacterium]
MAAQTRTRPYISSRFVLELDDSGSSQYMGTLQTIEGGTFKADLLEEKVGGHGAVIKYPGRPKFDDVTIQVGMAMAPRFWRWLKKSFSYEAERVDGSLVALDYDNKERWRRRFSNALIKEVTFPTLDGAAKEPAYLTVKFAVESLKEEAAGGNQYPSEQQFKDEWERQRMWLPSMFTFSVDGISKDPAETCKIDGFTIKQEIIENPIGRFLENQKEPGRVDFPNLSVTILQRDAGPWMKWWDALVREGKHLKSQQHDGHIWYLPRDAVGSGQLKNKPLLTLDLFGVTILGLGPVKHDSKQVQLQKVKLDLALERIDLQGGEGTV